MSSRTKASPHSKASPLPSALTSSSSSDSAASTVKVSSPLNPTHPKSPKLPPSDTASPVSAKSAPPASQSSGSLRSRGASVSTIRPPSFPLNRVVSSPIPTSTSSSTTTLVPLPLGSDFRSRSRTSSVQHRGRSVSPLRDLSFIWRSSSRDADPDNHDDSANWWTSREVIPRPWSQKKEKNIPVEQSEGYIRTRQASNFLPCEPSDPHLPIARRRGSRQYPWHNCGNRPRALAGQRGRPPVRAPHGSGRGRPHASLHMELSPIGRLATFDPTEALHPRSFREVHRFLLKQSHRPFIKRYLQRDEIQRALALCHSSLTDALGMFNTSIQIRILKQVLAAERQRQADTAALLDSINRPSPPLAIEPASPPHAIDAPPPGGLLLSPDEPADANPQQILTQLQTLTARQNDRDAVHDAVDLRQVMRTAIQANSDVEMIRTLQVGRDEMPEAIKTLQRALEKEVERERQEEEAVLVLVPGPANVPSVSVSVDVPQVVQSDPEGLKRSSTVHSTGSQTSSSVGSSTGTGTTGTGTGRSRAPRDTLDREFIETGIDALRRLSGAEVALPSWTITRYEVERDEKIGMGFFSDVFKGTWRSHVVAIKVLAPTTPRQLFVHEVSIWKTLQHPNVCELLGASSASSDPPWFFVSPYYKCGSLVTYLKGLSSLDSVDLLKMIHEIAKGMAYLHSKGVLHGDLKAANVLVNDKHHCIISDFGQSEMKSEAYRISGMPLPHGTLRWQAPELMSGHSNLTQEIDVYAFAITVIELLTKGALPWPLADDDAVRHFVLRENMRPEPPLQRVWSQQLTDILRQCWDRDPAVRPPFTKVDQEVQKLRAHYGADLKESPAPRVSEIHHIKTRKSPDMHPIPLPLLPVLTMPSLPADMTASFVEVGSAPSTEVSFMTAEGSESDHGHSEDYHGDYYAHHEAMSRASSRASSSVLDSQSEHEQVEYPRHFSPVPPDEHAQNVRDERRYRMLLQHEFHPSLTLPLWTPTPVAIGAVGYHSKANYGEFVTLFNCFDPQKTSNGRTVGMPSIYGYGRISQGNQRQDKRNVAQRSMDIIQSWLSSRNRAGEAKYSRRYSSPLRCGHKTAHLITESTNYRYLEDLSTPKKWFKANVDHILELYGAEHRISKEELYLVIGTLEAQDYALFVSHEHPDGQVDFNVFSAARTGHVWGEFSFSFDLSTSFLGGPKYEEEPVGNPQYARKVSTSGNPGNKWDSVLLARLRFKPDSVEPTSL
ncbi:transporter [Ganoderma sinense ZZ0214-1]|uniref:Transporter n=1 Tax=Ganoderma sinense ZZ0214-1 TaxID=1077348 RepID=A0A2G8RYK0_9APHY|nr:transporter [Ganoderma sinense ZZ0214-1]